MRKSWDASIASHFYSSPSQGRICPAFPCPGTSGRKGCADVYCNAQNLSNLTDGDLGKFFELVDTGEKKYVDEWKKYMQYLAVMINNIYNVLDCDVVLGGYVGGYMEKYLDELRRMVSERCTFATDGSFIKPCFFKHESSAVGAALYFVDKFIEEI